MWHF
jgi:hypothetical protein